MLDEPGQWGTGPFILSKGYSSIYNIQAVMEKKPYASTWVTVYEDRTPYVVLKANPNYWDKERGPKVKSIIFRNDLTEEQALNACMNTEGLVDIVTQVSPSKAKLVNQSKYAKLIHIGGSQILAGGFNRFQKDVDFSNRDLRLAFNYAINRQELIEQAFFGYASEMPALTPPWAFDYPKDLTPYQYNPNKAQEFFEKANWPAGRVLRISAPQKYQKAADILRGQLKASLRVEVAVNIVLPEEELNWRRVIAEKKLIPNWDIILGEPYALFYEGTPAYFHREFFGSDGSLRSGPKLPEFEKLFQIMAAETNRDALLEKAKEVDRYVYKEALALFLCAPHDLYAVNKEVDFKPYRTTFELTDTEVSDQHWSRYTIT
ncbi:MAG: ABC transporter substrate-binding protein [Neobacillus sp.]